MIKGNGLCTCGGKEIVYQPGVIAIMPASIQHEVNTGEEGLYLFAKFIPALC